MARKRITHGYIFRVLIAGFMLVILLLLAAAVIGVQSVRAIKQSVGDLVSEELVATRLIDDIQHEQAALSAVFMKLSRDPEAVDREKVLSELDQADNRLDEIGQDIEGDPEEPLWNEFKKAAAAFSAEARRLLSLEHPSTLLSRDLFRRHQESMAVVARLTAMIDTNAGNARREIDARAHELTQHSALLLGACILLALLCAVLTVRVVLDLFRKMERQTGELSRVSWHMLENQETAARRFSHELHDELGQALTAVKANLHSLRSSADGAERGRLEDCVMLVDESIRNVRELSQLLHPTILDDFGLDAAVRWLADRFMQRTGVEVEYHSDFKERLADDLETHLFRICQEALTNVARHSGATRVRIDLRARGDKVRLIISDNGRGLGPAGTEQQGMGLIGMRARALNAGGELEFRSKKDAGLTIDVEVPARGSEVAEKNPNPVSG